MHSPARPISWLTLDRGGTQPRDEDQKVVGTLGPVPFLGLENVLVQEQAHDEAVAEPKHLQDPLQREELVPRVEDSGLDRVVTSSGVRLHGAPVPVGWEAQPVQDRHPQGKGRGKDQSDFGPDRQLRVHDGKVGQSRRENGKPLPGEGFVQLRGGESLDDPRNFNRLARCVDSGGNFVPRVVN